MDNTLILTFPNSFHEYSSLRIAMSRTMTKDAQVINYPLSEEKNHRYPTRRFSPLPEEKYLKLLHFIPTDKDMVPVDYKFEIGQVRNSRVKANEEASKGHIRVCYARFVSLVASLPSFSFEKVSEDLRSSRSFLPCASMRYRSIVRERIFFLHNYPEVLSTSCEGLEGSFCST